MMLAEDSKAWDQAHGLCGTDSFARHLESTCRNMSVQTLADPCSASHGSPTDSASSLHADYALHGDCAGDSDDSSSSLLRCPFQ